MGSLDEVTRAVLAAEEPAINVWAARHGWDVDIDHARLGLTARTVHPVAGVPITFHADLAGYPVTPPRWTCRTPEDVLVPAAFPLPGSRPGINGSIFHPNQLICAPWSRLAYGTDGGPHTDWELTGWKTVTGDPTQAHTLPDMLSSLAMHLSASPGVAA